MEQIEEILYGVSHICYFFWFSRTTRGHCLLLEPDGKFLWYDIVSIQRDFSQNRLFLVIFPL